MSKKFLYHMYPFDRDAALVAYEEFIAENTTDSGTIGAAIYEACSDVCSTYEVWHGSTKLVVGPTSIVASAATISDRLMELVRNT